MEINIKDIKTSNNVRKDLGDLTELTASIKEKGILVPLIIDKTNCLVAGHRRLAAAKAAGLTVVPVIVKDVIGSDRVDTQLIENLQRENIHPMDEAETYAQYIAASKVSTKTLADKIGKSQAYVERRLALNSMIPEAKTAFRKGTFRLGAAVAFTMLEPKTQRETLRRLRNSNNITSSSILRGYNVESVYMNVAPFDMNIGPDGNNHGNTGCLNCPYNGASQQQLTALAEDEANPNGSTRCYRPGCYMAKLSHHVQALKADLKENGAIVLTETSLKAMPFKKQLDKYMTPGYSQKLAAAKKGNKKYGILIDQNKTLIEQTLYQIVPDKPKKGDKDDGQTTKTAITPKQRDKDLEHQAKKLTYNKMANYWEAEWRKTLSALATAHGETSIKILIMHVLKNPPTYNCAENLTSIPMKDRYDAVKNVLAVDNKKLMEAVTEVAGKIIESKSADELREIKRQLGYSFKAHWCIDENYLKMYTKDQLPGLAKDIGLPDDVIKQIKEATKLKERKDIILAQRLKGKVPSVLKHLE